MAARTWGQQRRQWAVNQVGSFWQEETAQIFVADSWVLMGYMADVEQAIGSKPLQHLLPMKVNGKNPNLTGSK